MRLALLISIACSPSEVIKGGRNGAQIDKTVSAVGCYQDLSIPRRSMLPRAQSGHYHEELDTSTKTYPLRRLPRTSTVEH